MVYFYSEPLVDRMPGSSEVYANESETLQTDLEYKKLVQDLHHT